ncbi:MAG: DUF3021 domain-containing protein [Clostridiales bacterium]
MKKIILLFLQGIAWGCTAFVFLSIVQILLNGNTVPTIATQDYLKYVLSSIIIGLGFFLPSLIYENQKLSMKLKTTFHMGIGLFIYFVASLYAGWIPISLGIWAGISAFIIMIIISFAIWFCFYIYNRHEAKKINEILKKI